MKLCKTTLVLGIAVLATLQAQNAEGPYKVLKTAKVGGDGGFDYVNADSAGRKLYVARTGSSPRINVYNLDTLEPVGTIPGVAAHGAVVSTKSGHGFASSKPIVMFDSKTLAIIKRIEVEGDPDGMLYDHFNDRVYVLSHRAPTVTVIDAASGKIEGTIDIGGAPEEAATDGKGHVYIDVVDKANIAVIDAKTLTVTGHLDLTGKGAGCAGLAMDAKNNVLFAACRNPQVMVVVGAKDGGLLNIIPIGLGSDGALFNPETMEAFSSQGDGTLTIVKENSPTSFALEQNLPTMKNAKTSTLDSKTNHVILIAAEFGPPPANQPTGGWQRRGPMVADSFTILVVGK
jgi:YVTN family beta-propeller protein